MSAIGWDHTSRAALRTLVQSGWTRVESPEEPTVCLTRAGNQLQVAHNQHWIELVLTTPEWRTPGTTVDDAELLAYCCDSYLCKVARTDGGLTVARAEFPRQHANGASWEATLQALLRVAERTGEVRTANDLAVFDQRASDLEFVPLSTVKVLFAAERLHGWHLRNSLASNHYHATFTGRERKFDVYLSFNSSWAYFQVPLLAKPLARGTNPAQDAVLYGALLAYNDMFYWAKLGVDDDGQVLLMVELPLSTLDPSVFRLATKTIARYAAECSYEAQILANLGREATMSRLLLTGRHDEGNKQGPGQPGVHQSRALSGDRPLANARRPHRQPPFATQEE